MTRHINPIKLREYLAAGLPVISTPLPEASHYAPDVLIADSAETFAAKCDQAIANTSVAQRRQRSQRMTNESWEAVVEKLSAITHSIVGQPRIGQSQRRMPSLTDMAPSADLA